MPIPEEELPLTLPETDNFKPSGTPESPLANMTEWINYTDARTGELCLRANSMTDCRPSSCLCSALWRGRHAMTSWLDSFIGLITSQKDLCTRMSEPTMSPIRREGWWAVSVHVVCRPEDAARNLYDASVGRILLVSQFYQDALPFRKAQDEFVHAPSAQCKPVSPPSLDND